MFGSQEIPPDNLTVNLEAAGFETYEDVRRYVGDLASVGVKEYKIDSKLVEALLFQWVKDLLMVLRSGFGQQLGAEILDRRFGDYNLQLSGKPSTSLSESVRALFPRIGDPFLPVAFRVANRLNRFGLVPQEPQTLTFQMPFVGETRVDVSPEDPYSVLKNLASIIDKSSIVEMIKGTREDIEIPEVTLSKVDVYAEIMSQEGVYQALEDMRQQGFDSILGKEMAREFSYQAAKIYIESLLPTIGYDLDKGSLIRWQTELVKAAEQAGYRGDARKFIERGYSMTYSKERELIDAVKANSGDAQLGLWNLDQYEQARPVVEKVMDFAEDNGIPGFKRYSKLPETQRGYALDTKGMGSYGISQEAQRHFVEKAIDWRSFLNELPEDLSVSGVNPDEYKQMTSLGGRIFSELALMGHGNVTERALQIIKGEVAAVGKDITNPRAVETWRDFYSSLRELLQTPKIHLMINGETGRLGFTIGTRGRTSK